MRFDTRTPPPPPVNLIMNLTAVYIANTTVLVSSRISMLSCFLKCVQSYPSNSVNATKKDYSGVQFKRETLFFRFFFSFLHKGYSVLQCIPLPCTARPTFISWSQRKHHHYVVGGTWNRTVCDNHYKKNTWTCVVFALLYVLIFYVCNTTFMLFLWRRNPQYLLHLLRKSSSLFVMWSSGSLTQARLKWDVTEVVIM